MDWLDLLTVQGTFKSPLQHHSSKASILQHSAFFMVQLSHPHMPTGKTIALTRQTFVGKVMSQLFNVLSRFVIAFFSRSKCLYETACPAPVFLTRSLGPFTTQMLTVLKPDTSQDRSESGLPRFTYLATP